jgi:CAP-Gly domain-containing linker protein 1
MATTPSRPRPSTSRIGIPTPVKSGSGLPTPGRSRSSSRAGYQPIRAGPNTDADSELMVRAFQQAIRSRDPRDQEFQSLTPASALPSHTTRPISAASTSSAVSAPTPRSSLARPKTPTQTRQAQVRPQSRQSDVFRASSRTGTNKPFEPGDPVRVESLGFEGTLRYIGTIAGKPGTWAGVELGPGFAGLGKNDGSVDG